MTLCLTNNARISCQRQITQPKNDHWRLNYLLKRANQPRVRPSDDALVYTWLTPDRPDCWKNLEYHLAPLSKWVIIAWTEHAPLSFRFQYITESLHDIALCSLISLWLFSAWAIYFCVFNHLLVVSSGLGKGWLSIGDFAAFLVSHASLVKGD